jgi:hypothetical protein
MTQQLQLLSPHLDRSRSAGSAISDAALFDVCAAASSFAVFSRIRVALAALGEPA